ncbi:hypothetical protein FRACYDRAFT_233389 [Fragilariopsis cylindrus CCMP1102]|uniref:Pseudouridine synthase RsuA/RluA-like domain-containing protein n=1 Tax=Fragilariopsis cylindrus CCMP1102 TaxID=635003 RepID=A0A1E7FYJ6_9STRA|nr:hypothetical protein FRACYDRAFT_233389 [Fragilariopsis cylindrus CCMP1102]|eukprot:OEU23220.1 hypothetical protein FRACYDRAFT_233389 [Fragilariopsis cylindrus CCMP1102]
MKNKDKNEDKNEIEEKRWINSIQIPLTKNQNQNQQPTIIPVLQLVGLKSSTRTIFARIQHTTIRSPHNNNKIDDDDDEVSHHRCCCFRVEDILDKVMERIRNDNDDGDNNDDNESVEEQEAVPSTRTLLELGSVWVLNPSNTDRPQNKPIDNGTENVLYQYQRYQRQMSIDSRGSSISSSSSKKQNDCYASLPQRLDTETSGLLIISTSSQFASYICKLLEQKTLAIPLTIPPTMISSTSTSTSTSTNIPVIQKRYKCLVGFNTKEIWDTIKTNYQICGRIVEHYVDVHSKAPKTFVTPVAVTTTTAPPNDTTTASASKWLSCQLRILTITPPISTSSISRSSTSTSNSTTTPTTTTSTSTSTSINVISKFGFVVYKYVAELEIELLTGRTHQIRGQLAALGCPIIGDPLYGGSGRGSGNGNDRNGKHHQLSLLQQSRGTTHNSTVKNKMALQCCQLSFTFENDNINDKKKKEKNTSKKKKKLLSKMLIDKEGNYNKAVGNANATATTNGSARSRDEQMTIQIHQEECSSNNSSNNSNSKSNLFHFRLDSAWWSDDIACSR